MIKKIFYALLLFLVIIQFIRPEKNVSEEPSGNDISTRYTIPSGVKSSLERACYDCHSNNTHYPWYSNIQPVAWWLSSHIEDGKRHLNFSEFAAYTFKRADHKMEEVVESQEDHWMPMESYLWMHKEAKLTDGERAEIITWANNLRTQIMADSMKVNSQ